MTKEKGFITLTSGQFINKKQFEEMMKEIKELARINIICFFEI